LLTPVSYRRPDLRTPHVFGRKLNEIACANDQMNPNRPEKAGNFIDASSLL
jgi:hypothetical protein